MKKLFTLVLLTMVSMGTWAKIEVEIANNGKFTGGTITEVKQSESGGKVTVTIGVTPDKDKGYTIKKNDIHVYATYPLSGARTDTRTPNIAGALTLYYNGDKDKDTKELDSYREYTFIVESGLNAWVKEANFSSDSKGGGTRFLPVEITTDENNDGNINDTEKKLYLIQTNAFQSFYIAPQANNTITTNNILGDYMLWYFLDAEEVSGVQYYYIVNNSTGKYICHGGGTGNNDALRAVTLVEKDASNEERCKFYIELNETNGTTGFYNIDAKGKPSYFGLNKRNGSETNQYPIRLTDKNYINDSNSKWKFIPYNGTFTWPAPPFTISTDLEHYYKIRNVQSNTFYASTDATPDKVTYSNTESNSMVWYFKEAPSDPSTPWFKYYYIVNPKADNKYMYYSGTAENGSDQTDAVSVKAYDSNNEDRFQFIVIQAAKGDGAGRVECYAIIPKLLRENYWTSNSIGSKNISNGTNMGIISSRSTIVSQKPVCNAHWQFVTTSYPLQCAAPTITYSSATGKITISSTTPGNTIHYTTDGVTEPTSSVGTPYSAPFVVSGPITIKAIATKTGFDDSEVTTKSFNQVATPSIQDNGSNAISITCETGGATIYYSTDGSTPTTEYTGPLTENVSGVTIKAIAVKDGMINSAVASGSVTLRCAKPVINKNGDNVTISCNFPASGVTICYTTNGDNPTSSSTPYTSPIPVEIGDVIKAIAIATGYENSEVATKTIFEELIPTEEGIYHITSQNDFDTFVDMASTTDGAAYHYILKTNVNAGSVITEPFTGIFEVDVDENGNFYKISGLRHALFNTINGGKVSNVILKDVIINNNDQSVNNGNAGAICNEAKGASRIYNCGILPTATNSHYDKEEYKVVIDGFTGSSIGGSGKVGSIVGHLSGNSRVINCFSFANITSGTQKAGIVGNNATAITQDNVDNASMVVNCMFYGDIASGGTISPVYGGTLIDNVGTTSVNGYNYFRGAATFDNTFTSLDDYKRSWPADEEYLTRFEYYRSILNSNRQLCTYWVTGKKGTDQTAADTALIAKWVLDPSIAPYPILKKWGKYPSVINRDPLRVWDPRIQDENESPLTPHWVNRDGSSVPDYHGKKLGVLKVTINPGEHAATGVSAKTDIEFVITDMDTLNCDYGYAKIQLPYYNEVFGDPTVDASQWDKRYGGNYKDYVVTGWDIISVTGGTPGTFTEAWENGYNFADRKCTEKDKHRTFAQGGYYYVPENVSKITITAHWGKAVYLRNTDSSIDRVNVTNGGGHGSKFVPAGALPSTFTQGQIVKTSLRDAVKALDAGTNYTVYDQAVVLAGNYQKRNGSDAVGYNIDSKWHPFTIMSVDLDLDNEPDYCMQWQFRSGTGRPGIQPIRFDFLPVVELGLAVRHDDLGYAIGIFIPQGHFEITETAYMHTTQFEYDAVVDRIETESPLILNGGHFEQIVVRNGPKNRTSYILMGGNFRMKRFTPGYHANPDNNGGVRHCVVNAIGGEYPEFYLSGIYRPDVAGRSDNPHCYTNGGRFGIMAGAGYEQVKGDITFKIDHSIIDEFYGGGINAAMPVTGKIDVVIDHSLVTKFCGGPKVGILGEKTATTTTYKTVTTHATGTTFGEFYGGGNGGTSYYRDQQNDNTGNFPAETASAWSFGNNKGFNYFYPLNNGGGTYDNQKGYHAEFEFEIFKSSNGLEKKEDVIRAYIHWAQFGTTTTGKVTNTLTDCIVKGSFYGGGNLADVSGDVESTLMGETHVYGSAFGGGFSASIPQFRIHDKSTVKYPHQDLTGTITDHGSLKYVKDGTKDRYYTWCYKDPETEVVTPAGVVIPSDVNTGNPTFQFGGKWYCYTTVPLVNLGVVSGNTTITVQGSCVVDGSVFGGGEESNVKGNTQVNITGGTITQNVFGGGKGKDDNFTCDKAMVGVNDEGACENPASETNKNKGTKVSISNGTVNGNVYGGGEVGRVEWNTQVEIGVGSGDGQFAPVIKGSVFGAGAGKETHGYSALVRGNSTVTVQGNAKVLQNVYGGGEKATVGRYWVKGITATPCEGETQPTIPEDLPDGMPYHQRRGGICKVVIQGQAQIGPNNGGNEDVGHVFGAGKGVVPNYVQSGEGASQKMIKGDENNPDRLVAFDSENAYLEFLQTLALVTNTDVTIGGGAKVKGSVFGGSESGYVQHNTNVLVSGGTIGTADQGGAYYGNVYGGGKGDAEHTGSNDNYLAAGIVKGSTKVKIEGGTILHNIYGGGAYGSVGVFDYDTTSGLPTGLNANAPENSGKAEIHITGGTIGTTGEENGMIFGSSRGDVGAPGSIHDKLAWVYDTHVAIGDTTENATITTAAPLIRGSIYGGGENGHNFRNSYVRINGGTIGIPSEATYAYRGNVYGGGCGTDKYDNDTKYNPKAGIVQGNAFVNITGGFVVHNVYGAGAMGSVGTDTSGGKTTVSVSGGRIGYDGNSNGNVYGAARGDLTATGNLAQVCETAVNISYTTTPAADNEEKTAQLIAGSVFGGGEAGTVKESVAVNMTGGLILNDVYGGGALANTQTSNWDATANDNAGGWADADKKSTLHTTTVRLTGGTVSGASYGGALGQKNGVNGATSDIAAYVYGDVLLDLNGTTTMDTNTGKPTTTGTASANTTKGCVVGQLFGCNNVNGSPKGDVMVHVYATQNKLTTTIAQKFIREKDCDTEKGENETDEAYVTRLKGILTGKITFAEALDITVSQENKDLATSETASAAALKTAITGITTSIDAKTTAEINAARYDMVAVYGGGNMAAYVPVDPNTAEASTASNPTEPNGSRTQVIIEGCEETSIETVYGGGNAAAVPETNVEIREAYEIQAVFGGGNGKDNLPNGDPNPGADIGTLDHGTSTYGTGNANSALKGGYIHEAYGGSNTKGIVKGNLNQTTNPEGSCELIMDKIVGAGKYADIDGDVNMTLTCQPSTKVPELFAGADEANVNGNITLNITNGHFGKVFGGNNLGGAVKGKITVNVEETGCQPIRIDELYLGGNEAAYSVFGYYESEETHPVTGKKILKPRESATDTHLPVQYDGTSYASISDFTNYAQPELNIISCTYIGKVFGGGLGEPAIMYANPTVNINMIPGTATGSLSGIGTIGDVYGGGNAAKIVGNTTVNIGTDETVLGANITGNVYGGGNLADVAGDTYVNICAKYDNATDKFVAVAEGTSGVTIGGNVFGGGKGSADTYECEAAMVGEVDKDYGSTHVVIGNGTVGTVENGKLKEKTGNVYGGGEIGRVEKNTSVTIGLSSEGVSITSNPVIEGKVFGAGCGLRTHGYSALVRGDATVTIQANAQVKGNVYGGGEMSTVGKYWVKGVQYPASLNPPPAPDWVYDWMPYQWRSGGTCTVSILDHAVIGPDNNMKMITDNGPDDAGHVFGACQGVLPYQGFTDTEKPWRMQQGNIEDYFYINNKFSEDEYFRFIETLALATKTEVTIGDNAFVMGSVYGGSENGRVQEDTHVTIQDNCQIGCGDGITTPYTAAQWESENPADFKECASWTFEPPYAPYDMYKLDANGKPIKATDGHTFYGNVFGGGSGYYPYKQDPDYEVRKPELGGKSKKELGYADGLWFENAGAVYGNTQVDITGGHILTSVYGGNEMTNVGTYKNDRDYVEKGHCVINMSGGTVGVPRSSDDAKHHPVTCYVFGAGKGDPRINFNRWTNVASTEVNITGNARIFGSTFGGGEDGHVIGDAVTTVNGDDVIIGSTGTSGVDGNIFGGGRGFSEDALTAGVVGGNVTVNFKNGKILGTLYGGGRLASVGTNFANVEDTQHYGKMQADTETQTHGHITVNIEGGTIGATDDAGNLMASDSSIGDVFGGCKGSSSETPNMDYGLSKYTQINMTGGKVNGSVYGGGEVAMVEANTTIQISGAEKVDNVYGGGKGLIDHAEAGMIQGDTHVTISEAQGKTTTISHNVYGGGEAGVVNGNVAVDIMGGHVMQDVYGGGALANTNTGNWGSNNTWAEGKYSNLATFYKTNVTLKGGTIDGNVYGGGLGRQEKDEVQAVEGSGTYGQPDYVEPVPYQPAVSPIEALVYGDVLVKLNENTEIDKCVVKGSVFGCNNLNGSPQSAVTVHVYKTWGDAMTAQADLDDPDDSKHHYHLAAVYGGGNQSAFYPQFKDTRDSVQTRVIIDGCDLSSIRQVYGGGNAASSPATSVTINSAYEIEEVFGGGNGYGTMPDGSVNPGANVGYTHYPVEFDPPASTVEYRTNNYGYGSGVASVNIFNGRIHRVFGGSNTKGNVRKSAVTILEKMSEDCAFVIDEVYGGGKSAPMDAEAKLLMSCIPGLKEVYGGAQNADINNNVVLNITNGEYDRVFGGNNKSGSITGAITVNIEETGCKPVIIGQVYGGGNLAAYNGPWVDENDHSKGRQGPTVNVKAFTSIGEVYGGGYGASAKVTGDTYVNVNEVILSKDETGQSEDYSIKDFKQDVIDEDHPEQEYKTMDLGNDNKFKLWYRPVKKDSNNVPIPAMGVIGNVFGGGNAAPVEGSTHVNIGNKATETIVTLNDLQKEVKGVDIRGNVYGGGNKAEVTGNTNVVVGKNSE